MGRKWVHITVGTSGFYVFVKEVGHEVYEDNSLLEDANVQERGESSNSQYGGREVMATVWDPATEIIMKRKTARDEDKDRMVVCVGFDNYVGADSERTNTDICIDDGSGSKGKVARMQCWKCGGMGSNNQSAQIQGTMPCLLMDHRGTGLVEKKLMGCAVESQETGQLDGSGQVHIWCVGSGHVERSVTTAGLCDTGCSMQRSPFAAHAALKESTVRPLVRMGLDSATHPSVLSGPDPATLLQSQWPGNGEGVVESWSAKVHEDRHDQGEAGEESDGRGVDHGTQGSDSVQFQKDNNNAAETGEKDEAAKNKEVEGKDIEEVGSNAEEEET
ncbi:uncharacterized protein DS421_3g102430 [Arachis hypogaea]|nr:uncharacterized protein DS421_3g102430 [Arachis hypogaea]